MAASAQEYVPPPADPALVAQGALLFRAGVRVSGQALLGQRRAREPVSGRAAACINCHRASGMGQVEADVPMPPITGPYLFGRHGALQAATMDPRVSKRFNQAHEPYTEPALARAVRDGVNIQDRPMSEVMPRFDLDAADVAALAAYLRQLSAQWSPGVSATTLSLATVITPEVEPLRRKAFIDMMQAIVRQHNASTVVAGQGRTRHHMVTAAEMMLGTERSWDLQIWELSGPAAAWPDQLEARAANHPVFALVSGLSETSWQPVQDFCEATQLPCWFPSVALPGRQPAQYTFYFSGGVRLEATLLAQALRARQQRPRRIVQFHGGDTVGQEASRALEAAAADLGIPIEQQVLGEEGATTPAARAALAGLGAQDLAVFWLRPAALQALAQLPAPAAECEFSGELAGSPAALPPPGWRQVTRLVYPYELPGRRPHNLDYFHAWMHLQKLSLVDEAMQSEVYFAMNFLTDTLSEMLDNLYRDYLVERGETMLVKRELGKAEQELRDREALGRAGDLVQRHGPLTLAEEVRLQPAEGPHAMSVVLGTTMYPHLSLGPGQRLASRSGYLARFAEDGSGALEAVTPLLTPSGR